MTSERFTKGCPFPTSERYTAPVIRGLAFLVVFAVFAPATSHAFCRSLSVVSASSSCRQECLELSDFSPEEIESRRIVELGWRRRCMEYVVDARESLQLTQAEVEAVFERSFQTWLDVSCGGESIGFDVRLGPEPGLCNVPQYVSGGANANTMALVSNWSGRGHAGGAFALTTTWFDTTNGEIFDADMELNQEFWVFDDCPDSGCEDGVVDLENTVTHELGHFFGLAHTPDDEMATMWACADEAEIFKRDLTTDDAEGLCAAYPPPDTLPAECDYTPRGGFDPLCRADRPKEGCGCSAPGAGDTSAGWLWVVSGLIAFRLRRRA